MKASSVVLAIAMAATASAAPWETTTSSKWGSTSSSKWGSSTPTSSPTKWTVTTTATVTATPSPTNVCSSNSTPVCCNKDVGLLGAVCGVLGSSCDGESYCCSSNAEGVVVVNALNCVELNLL